MSNIKNSDRIRIAKKLRSIGFLTTEKPIFKKRTFKKNVIYCANYRFVYNNKGYSSSGISFNNQENAQSYAIGEALERYQMLKYKDETNNTSQNLRKIPAKEFEIYDTDKIDSTIRQDYVFTDKSHFLWEEVFDKKNQEKVLVPAQLLYNIYLPEKNEKTIRTTISTGAACGPDYSFALLKGLIEIIERDNFTLYYLTRCPPPIINITQNKELSIKVGEISGMLHSRILILDFSYDFSVYVICVFIISLDGTLCSIGLGSDFNLIDAIEHALLEAEELLFAFQKIKANIPDDSKIRNKKKLIDIMLSNAKRWIIDKPVENLAFFTEGKYIKIDSYEHKIFEGKSQEEKLTLLIDELFDKNYDLYIKTAKEVVPGFTTIKALVPQFVPLYVIETLPYKITPRMKKFMDEKKIRSMETKDLFPPPFL